MSVCSLVNCCHDGCHDLANYHKIFIMGTKSQYSYYTNVQNCNLKLVAHFSIVGISAMRRLVAPNGSNLMLT